MDHNEESLQDTLERLAHSDAALSAEESGQVAGPQAAGSVPRPSKRFRFHRPRNAFEWRYLLVVPVAIFALWWAWGEAITWWALQFDGQQTTATVLDSHCGAAREGSSAQITYDANGVEYIATLGDVGCPPSGTDVAVVYSTEDPTVVGGSDSVGLKGLSGAAFWFAGGALMLAMGARALVERTDAEAPESSTRNGEDSPSPRDRRGSRTD